jgi:hypothetical protein
MTTKEKLKSILDHAETVAKEASGAVTFFGIKHEDLAGLLADAGKGDMLSLRLCAVVYQVLDRFNTAPADSYPSCVGKCCRRLDGIPFSFAACLPASDTPGNAIGMTVCDDCAHDREEIRQCAMRAMKGLGMGLVPISTGSQQVN